jgi:ABC-type lipoprotein release transport system permease subunit
MRVNDLSDGSIKAPLTLDVPIFRSVTAALALAALITSYIPARRATRADPMVALGRG